MNRSSVVGVAVTLVVILFGNVFVGLFSNCHNQAMDAVCDGIALM